MKNQTVLLLIFTLVAFMGCKKDNDLEPYLKNKSTTITLRIGEQGLSKGVGEPSTTEPVMVGTSFQVNSFIGSESQGADNVEFVRVDETNLYRATVILNGDATSITLTGNQDGVIVGSETLSSDINTRQGDNTQPIILVSGSAPIVTGLDNSHTVEVNLTPEMARIEIIPDYTSAYTTPSTTFRYVKLSSVFLNNTKIDRDGEVIDTPSDKISPSRGDDYFRKGIKRKLNDVLSVPPDGTSPHENGWKIIDIDGAVIQRDYKTIVYNIFPQEGGADAVTAKANHPHIIFSISGQKHSGTGWTVFSKYLNITAFKDETGSYVTNFEAGSIYTFTLGDIINLIVDPNTVFTDDPDPDPVPYPIATKFITCSVGNLELKSTSH